MLLILAHILHLPRNPSLVLESRGHVLYHYGRKVDADLVGIALIMEIYREFLRVQVSVARLPSAE
jgi:hypothetical protein